MKQYNNILSATVPKVRQGLFERMSGCSTSEVLFSCFMRADSPPCQFLPYYLRSLFFYLFAFLFQNSFFYSDWYQKLSKWKPQNGLTSQKSAKTQHRNAPTVKTCKKKDFVWKGSNH